MACPRGAQAVADFHSPISKAVQPEETAGVLSKYRSSQKRGREEYASMVTAFYDLITDFYEYGWGRVVPLRADEGWHGL